ncbi:MAG: hypothetical protein NW203_06455, partial [Hyphomonadaceae bacterium]|nr:hypothetical protein [Hyphomonadaceae bacterium]
MSRKHAPNLSMRLVGPADAKIHLYRWSPGPALRAGGFKGLDLWTDGPALSLADWRAAGFAAPASDELRAKGPRARPMGPTPAARVAAALTDAARAALANARMTPQPRRSAIRRAAPARFTLARLLDDFLAAKAKTLPAKTLVNYRSHLVPVRAIAGDELAAALTKDLILDMHEALEPRGAHAAYKAIQTLRTALIWAHGRGEWRGGAMPAREDYTMLGLSKPAPRLRVGTPEEMDALRLAFDDPHAIYAMTQAPAHERTLAPRLSGGDALIMLLWTAARVGDGLAMHEGHLRSESGADWLAYRQAKTGA